MRLWFVTPAWQRFEISDICFEQRAWLIEELRKGDIDAHCVVIANDGNRKLAAKHGFDCLVRSNKKLGKRFNDGIEHACREGADAVCLVGSDDWVHPDYFEYVPTDAMLSGHFYSVIDERAESIAELWVEYPAGVGPYTIPRSLLEASSYRPVNDSLNRGINRSVRDRLALDNGELDVLYRDAHALQLVGFRSGVQMNGYAPLVNRWGTGANSLYPMDALRTVYPGELVAGLEDAYRRLFERCPLPEKLRHVVTEKERLQMLLAQRRDDSRSDAINLKAIIPSQGGKVLSASVRGGMIVYAAELEDGRVYKDFCSGL